MRAVAGGHLLGVAADAVVDAFAGEDAGRAGFDAGGAGGGLFGGVEVQQIGALAAGGEGGEGFVQRGVSVELLLQLFRNKLGNGFVDGFDAGFFVFDNDVEERLQVKLQRFDFSLAGEGDEAPGLGVLAGFLEEAAGICEQGAVAEHEPAVVFEAADEDDVVAVVGVAGLVPLELFGETGVEDDAAQGLHLRLPLFGAGDVFIDGGVLAAHGG